MATCWHTPNVLHIGQFCIRTNELRSDVSGTIREQKVEPIFRLFSSLKISDIKGDNR